MDNKKKFKENNDDLAGPSEESSVTNNLVTINDVDNVCLAEIFSYLNYCDRLAIEEVCRKWQQIGSQLSWNNVSIFKDSHIGAGPIDMIKLFKRCGRFLKLLSSRKRFNSNIMRIIGAFCPNLSEISLTFLTWNSNDFVRVFYGMKNLTTVEINMRDRAPIIIDGYTLLKNLPETIQDFSTHCVDFDSLTEHQNLEPLSGKLCVLRYLGLNSAKLDNQIMEWIFNKESLIYLSLESSWMTGVSQPTEPINLPNLRCLELCDLYYLDDNLIMSFIKSCKKLNYFNINYTECPEAHKKIILRRDVGCLENLENLENLKKLHLSGRSDSVTDRDVENIENLQVFECKHCERITDRSIMKIITNSWRLRELNVLGTSITAATLKHADLICKSRKQMLHMIVSDSIMLNQIFENDYLSIEPMPEYCEVFSDDETTDDDDDDPE